jgi:iron complex outermembrane receptor protein
LAHSQVSIAQTDEEDLALVYGDKSTISIVTGSQQTLRRAPAVATVITAQDIAAMGATDLDEVLESVPGLHVSRTNTYTTGLYVIRGIYAQNNPQTLILQNGIPVTTMLTGNKGNIWSGYPVDHIARIEVIRGPGSALYGADAYSGVINIITKTAADTPGTQFGVRAGSFNSRDAWVQHGGQSGPVDVAFYLRAGSTDGFSRIIDADAQSRTDKAFGTHASLAPGPVNTGYDALDANLDLSYEKWRWRTGYKLRDNVGTGAGVASALDPVGKEKTERITSDVSWNDAQFAKDWGVGMDASYMSYQQRMPTPLVLLPPGTVLPTGSFPNGMIGAPETSERQIRLSAFAIYSGFAGHNWRFGIGHDDLNMYDTSELRNFNYTAGGTPVPLPSLVNFDGTAPFLLPQRRKVDYLYAQDEWNFAKDWTLTAGVRHDRYSDSGSTTNPRLALVWDAQLDVTVKLLYGRAFRAPAFAELYGITNPVAIGNPDLRPETINTLEAAVAWQLSRDVSVNLSAFRYSMQDIIRLVPRATAGTGSVYQNTGDQTGQGMELELVWDVNRSLRVSGNYAHQRSIDETTQQDAGYAPHNHLYSRADWRFASGWTVSGQVNYVADRKRAAGDTRPPIADYTTLDLTLRSEQRKNSWSFAASVRNLFNADVREPSLAPGTSIPNDLPMAPRAVYVQATYQM